MTVKYVIDTCALVDANQNYSFSKRVFNPIWTRLAELFTSGELISSSEVLEEIKDDDLLSWLSPYRKCFLPLSKEVQEQTSMILSAYPDLVKIRTNKPSSNGDPFLIATALVTGGVVVTNEKQGIPKVCEHFEVRCIRLKEFVDEVFE